MRRIIIIGIITVVLLLPLASLSCVATSGDISATLGQEFTLPLGENAYIESENLMIKFDEIVEDSRCPQGAECVWEGEAQCRLHFTLAGSPAEMVLTQPGGDVSASDYFIMYKIVFNLEPYPEEGKQIADSDYQLVMTVTKP